MFFLCFITFSIPSTSIRKTFIRLNNLADKATKTVKLSTYSCKKQLWKASKIKLPIRQKVPICSRGSWFMLVPLVFISFSFFFVGSWVFITSSSWDPMYGIDLKSSQGVGFSFQSLWGWIFLEACLLTRYNSCVLISI